MPPYSKSATTHLSICKTPFVGSVQPLRFACTYHPSVVALLYRSSCDTAIKFTQRGVGRAPAHQNRTEQFIEKHSPWNCVNLGHMPALLAVIRRLRTWEKALCRKGFSSQILYVIFFVSFFSILEQFWAVRPGVFS